MTRVLTVWRVQVYLTKFAGIAQAIIVLVSCCYAGALFFQGREIVAAGTRKIFAEPGIPGFPYRPAPILTAFKTDVKPFMEK